MSKVAPWLALSSDWMDSEMFDEATDGERLAWICLLCHAKAHGRGGRVAARKNALIRAWRISERAYDGMMKRAQNCGAVRVDGETITLCNWKSYQDKADKSKRRDSAEMRGLSEKAATQHPAPSTQHREEGDPPKAADAPAPAPVESKPVAKSKRERPSQPGDPLWNSVMLLFHPSGLPPSQRSRIGKAVQDLLAINATPDELKRRYENAVHNWQGRTVTVESVIRNWDQLDSRTAQTHPASNHAGRDGAAGRRAEKRRGEFAEPVRPLPFMPIDDDAGRDEAGTG